MEETAEAEQEATSGTEAKDDEALQDALASGSLKPGLYGQYSRTVTQRGKFDKEGLSNALKSIRLELGWLERLDMVGGLAPLTRSAYEAVGVDFDEAAVRELEQLEAALAEGGKTETSHPVEGDTKQKRDSKTHLKRAERSVVANDFVREMHFYRQAQAAVIEGVEKLHAAGVVTRRPADYFAEMAKSDVHMKRVRDRLLHLENRLALAEKAKRIREARRFAKEAERERAVNQKAATRHLDELVDSVRSGKRKAADIERELATETNRAKQLAGTRAASNSNKKQKRDVTAGNNKRDPQGRRDAQGPSKTQPRRNKKRERKDAQYGFGGQKKRGKWNTRESNEDVDRSFSRWRSSGGPKFNKSAKFGNCGNAKRPGKRARQSSRNKKAS